jgi:protein-S-isoprenylcysteine O-methyltransferase Ste14
MPYRWIIFVLWLALFAYWVISAWGNKATVYRVNPVWRALALLAIVVVFLLIEAFPRFFHHHLYFPGAADRAAGVAVCAAGVGIAIWARHTLGRNWSGNPTIKEGHELIERGPYRYVRHPIYSGILLGMVGTGLGSGQIKHLFVIGTTFVIFWTKLRIEESLMLRQFPETYAAYMKRTKALIPFVV